MKGSGGAIDERTSAGPTKVVLGIGPERSEALRPWLRAELRWLGDERGRVQVVEAPLAEELLGRLGTEDEPVGVWARPGSAFQDWVQEVVRRPPRGAPMVWVLPHLAPAAAAYLELASDPATRVVVVGRDGDCTAYEGSPIRYVAAPDQDQEAGVRALAAALAAETLFRFRVPDREPVTPWEALARVNYQQAGASVPRRLDQARAPEARRGSRSPDGRWLWDGRRWVPDALAVASPAERAARPPIAVNRWEDRPLADLGRRRRWFGRAGRDLPPSPRDVRELIPWRVPLVICVTGVKGGLGKTTTCAGLLLAAQDACPPGMPLLAVDSDPRHPSLARFLGLDHQTTPLWESIARYTSSRELIPPAPSRSLIYVYEQSERIRALDSMFDARGQPQAGIYDVPAFMERLTREYQIVVVDASSDQDVSSCWLQVADAIVVTTDSAPPTVARTQEYVGLLDYWRRSDAGRAQTPILCAWLATFRNAPSEVARRRRRLESGFELRIGEELMRTEGIPVVTVPREQPAHDATDYAGLRRCGVMATYRTLFGRIVKSVLPARMRAWAATR